jgi:3-oxoacyl-[acyl-carrier-protein] synthase II
MSRRHLDREPRRVVVTGIGAVTPIGSGATGLWKGVLEGQSVIRPIDRFDTSGFRSRIAAHVDDFEPARYMDTRRIRRLDRFSQFSVAAAYQALVDAQYDPDPAERESVGVYIGSALGGIAYGEEQHRHFVHRGLRSVSPMVALAVFGGAGACNVAMEFDFRGPATGNADSCASSTIAIGEAFHAIRDGEAIAMVAGGAEAPLSPLAFGAFALIKSMSTRNEEPELASRPFDRRRDGFVMGEGAAILLLEEREHALARDAPIYAEVLGFGATNDAYHMTAPRPDGSQSARAINRALRDAGLPAEAIDYVNAHASATPLNDSVEVRAIKRALGDRAYQIPVTGTKGLHGHALGASGAFEAAITCLAIDRGYVPGTANLLEPDPACDLEHLPLGGRSQTIRYALSNSFGFGGINACLVFGARESRQMRAAAD